MIDSTIARGSLIKLLNVMAADFTQEAFLNIGAFTLEHLDYVVFNVKGSHTTLAQKSNLL